MRKLQTARQVVRRVVVAVVLVGGVIAAVVAVDRARPEEEVAVAAVPLQVATAERTDLSADATLDGTVESSSSLTVLHRIEGATPTTSTGSTADPAATGSTPAGGASAQGVGLVQLQPVAFVAASATSTPVTTSPDSTMPDTTEPPTTVPDTTEPPTTVPDTTEPTTTTTEATSTTPEPTTVPPETSTIAPSTTPTATDPPAECPSSEPTTTSTPDTTSTTVTDPSSSTSTTTPTTCTTTPPASTVPGAARGGSRALPGGELAGGSGSGGGATGSAGATTSITERVTSLPAVGDSVANGDVLYTVDGRPVVALAGTLPAWRTLSTSADDGADIAQLELSLAALGYDADGSLVVDNEYDSATAEAVEAWQTGLGLEATGEVELGDVVFLPSAVTVTALDTTVGADVTEADQIVQVSGSSLQVVAPVTDDVVGAVVPGLEVRLAAAGGEVTGIVTLLRSVTADDGTISVEAVITPLDSIVGQAGGSSIDVTVALDGPMDAISVPADALVSKLDGSYAVEVRDEAGDHWVTVEVVAVRGTQVAVNGIDAGTQVLVPA